MCEQSCATKFCVRVGESAIVTYEKLQRVYGEHSLFRAQVFRWHKSFLEGREQVKDEPCANLWLKVNQSHYFSATPCMLAVGGKFV
jgi:hypothetical protein